MKTTRILLSLTLLVSGSHIFGASSSSAAACSSSTSSAHTMWEPVGVAGFFTGRTDTTQKATEFAKTEIKKLKKNRLASAKKAHLECLEELSQGHRLREVKAYEHHAPAACLTDAYLIPSGNVYAQDFTTALHTNVLHAVEDDYLQFMALVQELYPTFETLSTEEQLKCKQKVGKDFAVYAHSNWGIYLDNAPRHADHKTDAYYHWTRADDCKWQPHMVRETSHGWTLSAPNDMTPEEQVTRDALLNDIRTTEAQLSDRQSDLRWIYAIGVVTRERAKESGSKCYEGRTIAMPGITREEAEAIIARDTKIDECTTRWLENSEMGPRWIRNDGKPSTLDKLPSGHHAQYHWDNGTSIMSDRKLISAHQKSYAKALSAGKFIKTFAAIEKELLERTKKTKATELSCDRYIATLPTTRDEIITDLALDPTAAYYVQAAIDGFQAKSPSMKADAIFNTMFGAKLVTQNERTTLTKICAEVLRNVPDSSWLGYKPTSVKQFYDNQQALTEVREAIAQEKDADKKDTLTAKEAQLVETIETLVEHNINQAIDAINVHVDRSTLHRDTQAKDLRLIELHKVVSLLQYATDANAEHVIAVAEQKSTASAAASSSSSSATATPKVSSAYKGKGKGKAKPSKWKKQRRPLRKTRKRRK